MSDLPDKHDDRSVSFVQRWSQRKHQQHAKTEPTLAQDETKTNAVSPGSSPISEQELPPIESLHEDSEVSMFLSDGISEALQRRVLRKLFHLGKFNVCDGLDDYADDYSVFQPLRDVLTAQRQLRDVTDKLKQMQADDAEALAPSTSPTPLDAEPAIDDNPQES